jgi:hypothetical protein
MRARSRSNTQDLIELSSRLLADIGIERKDLPRGSRWFPDMLVVHGYAAEIWTNGRAGASGGGRR